MKCYIIEKKERWISIFPFFIPIYLLDVKLAFSCSLIYYVSLYFYFICSGTTAKKVRLSLLSLIKLWEHPVDNSDIIRQKPVRILPQTELCLFRLRYK